VQSALTLYFFTTGTRTPLLALLSLRRPRNLAPIVLAYAGLGLVAVVVGDPVVAILALSPSPLIGPTLARFVGAREETVGALLTGTIVLSFPLLLSAIPGIGQQVNIALFAFVIGTALASAVPLFRDLILPIVDGARYLALAIILGAGGLAALSFVDPRAIGVAALGANCGRSLEDTDAIVVELLAASSGIPLWIKPNAGVPRIIGDAVVYEADPETLARHIRRYADQGARVVGGCCGTTPEHVAAIALALER